MARNSEDREDLMAEVVTLSPRVEFQLPDSLQTIVAGRRVDGRWSVFLGGDPVYHFDAQNRLRRAFMYGLLYRSQGATLARLVRQESEQETVLLRHDLNPDGLDRFLSMMCENLRPIVEAAESDQLEILSRVPPDVDYLPELTLALKSVLYSGGLLSPAITKR